MAYAVITTSNRFSGSSLVEAAPVVIALVVVIVVASCTSSGHCASFVCGLERD